MVTKARLHELVERLPDAEVATAERVLEALGDRDWGTPFRTFAAVPFDDEPEDAEEAALVEEALADLARGDFVPHAEVRRLIQG